MQNRKVVALLVVSVFLASFFTYVFASSPSATFTISSGVYPGAPSYTVFSDGTNYYAKNSWGVIAYTGTAPDVINAAQASLTNGGTIYLLGGEYPLGEDTIVIDNPKVFLEGENWETTKITATNNAINITDAVGSGVKNLCLVGSDVAESIGISSGLVEQWDPQGGYGFAGDLYS